MKKALLASTAIITAAALASPAAAADRIKLSLGGYMEQYIGYAHTEKDAVGATGLIGSGRDFRSFDQQSDTEIYFQGNTTLDNGIKLALRVELEADATAGNNNKHHAAIDESWLDIQTAWGTLRLGADDPVSDLQSVEPRRGILNDYNLWVPAVGVPTKDDPYFVDNGGDDNGVYYISPKIFGFQAAASYQAELGSGGNSAMPNSDSKTTGGAVMSATLNWAGKVGDVSIATGYAYLHETSASQIVTRLGASGEDKGGHGFVAHNVGLNVSYAGFGVGAAYGRQLEKNANGLGNDTESDDGHSYVVGLWYINGPIEVGYNHKYQQRQGRSGIVNGTDTNAADDENTLDGVYFNYQISDGVKWESMVFNVDYDEETNRDQNFASGGWGVVGGLRLDF